MQRNYVRGLLICLIPCLLAGYAAVFGKYKLGIDLAGGTILVYEVNLERTQQQIEGAIAETPAAEQATSTPAVPTASADSHPLPAAGAEAQVAAPSAASEPEPLAPPEPAKLDAGNRPA